MKLTLQTLNHYERLTDPAERAALERELALILGWARVVAMEDGGRTWKRGGNGHSTAAVERRRNEPARLTEAQVEGMVCNLGGG